MELFKVVNLGDKVSVKTLTYNDRVWSGFQWAYSWVRINSSPTNDEKYATDFKTVDLAEAWINEHTPR
jgi:hypothetical protein